MRKEKKTEGRRWLGWKISGCKKDTISRTTARLDQWLNSTPATSAVERGVWVGPTAENESVRVASPTLARGKKPRSSLKQPRASGGKKSANVLVWGCSMNDEAPVAPPQVHLPNNPALDRTRVANLLYTKLRPRLHTPHRPSLRVTSSYVWIFTAIGLVWESFQVVAKILVIRASQVTNLLVKWWPIIYFSDLIQYW